MAYDFASLSTKTADIAAWLAKEYLGIRTGRAVPALLDGVQVHVYGANTPLNHVAGIAIEDAKTLRVTPYDMSQVKEVEKAIVDANLGVSVGSDEHGVRVSFPELTSERRAVLSKMLREKLEEARIALRRARDEVWDDIQAQEKHGEISEDEKFRHKDEMQNIIDAAGKELEAVTERKEREIAA